MTTTPAPEMSTTKRALLALRDLQAKLDAYESASHEPIAIIGMGCRFPGDANTPAQYWQLLMDGVDAIGEVPTDRWDLAHYYDADPAVPGKMYSRYGGFLRRVDQFDPAFFNISPREAASLDPQQRLLLEVAWEAFEDATLAPEKLFGSQTGVFIGISGMDYARGHLRAGADQIDGYFGTGISLSVAAGRLSYVLGLTGPSMVVDTACSSSLVALHLACQSLRNRECGTALAGGVNVMLAPEVSVNFSKAGMLAPDGRCKTFDASGDGYTRGEGCGVVVLKRLSDAVAAGDTVIALIRGSAVNQDGPSGGLTVPSGPSQQSVIRQALERAGIEPGRVSYIEAHGTGTSLGDPIEIGSLGSVFGKHHTAAQPLVVGSAKTNIGHLESAAGIAGVIKVVLALHHKTIPPNLHFNTPNPHIPWASLPIKVPTQAMAWDGIGGTRLAGVSAFGFSGTNAHIVLEEAPSIDETPAISQNTADVVLLSGKSEAAVRALAGSYADYLAQHPAVALSDLAFTAAVGRSHFVHRLSVVATDTESLTAILAQVAAGETPTTAAMGHLRRSGAAPSVAFVFTDTLPTNANRNLYTQNATFRTAIDEANALLTEVLLVPLVEVLYDTQPVESSIAQPVLVAAQVALARVWQHMGIEPSVVMGIGAGEISAAIIAGVFSLEDGLKLAVANGNSLTTLAQTIKYRTPQVAYISGATGSVVSAEIAKADYWATTPTNTVKVEAAIATLYGKGARLFAEFGASLNRTDAPEEGLWLSAGLAGRDTLLAATGILYAQGVTAQWDALWTESGARRIGLPTYPFQRKRYWLSTHEAAAMSEVQGIVAATPAATPSVESITTTTVAKPAATPISTPTHAPASSAATALAHPDWRTETYQLHWRPITEWATRAAEALRVGIIGDGQGVAAQLAAYLNGTGHAAWLLTIDELEAALTQQPDALTHIVYADALTQTPLATAMPDQLETEVADVMGQALRLIEIIKSLRTNDLPHLWFVTRGAQSVFATDTVPAAEQSHLWGLGRTSGLENPTFWGGLVDLDPATDRETAAYHLLVTLVSAGDEEQVAWRDGSAYGPHLHPVTAPTSTLTIHPDGQYLITGGLKGFGLECAKWLVRQGARHLLLCGRSLLPSDSTSSLHQNVRDLEQLGATVRYAALDVGDAAQLQTFLGPLLEAGPPLRGVIHCASVWQDDHGQPLIRVGYAADATALRAVIRPKVVGSWLIARLCAPYAPDFHLFFSTAASLFGSVGQGAYAAVNAFMDSWSHHLQRLGIPALSANWGAIGGVGFGDSTAGRKVHEHWERRGIGRLTPAQSLDTLPYWLGRDVAHVGPMKMNWTLLQTAYPVIRRRPWAARVLAGQPDIAPLTITTGYAAPQETPMTSSPSDRYQRIVVDIRAQVASLLHMEPTEIELDEALLEIGADSIVLIDAVRRIENSYGVKVTMQQFFEDLSTLERLAQYIDATIPPETVAAPATPVVAQAAPTTPQTPSALPDRPAVPSVGLPPLSALTAPQPQAPIVQTPPPVAPTPAPIVPAYVATPSPAPVVYTASAPFIGSTAESGVTRIIEQQLQVMAQQLDVLRGVPSAPVAAPAPVVVAALPAPMNGNGNGNGHSNGHSNGNGNGNGAYHNSHPPDVTVTNGVPTQIAAKLTPDTTPKAVLQTAAPSWKVSETKARSLTPQQQAHLDALVMAYTRRTQKSKALTQRYRPVLADNRASAGFRLSIKEMLYPLIGDKAQGAHLWDVDGNEYIDVVMGFGVALFGNSPDFITQALLDATTNGAQIGTQSALAGEVAALVSEITGMERVTFVNTGTEAVMTALRLARTVTGRAKVVLFAGSYHGHFDGTLGMATSPTEVLPLAPGVMEGMVEDIMILEYGSDTALATIRRHAHEIAAVLVEPVQSRRPDFQPREFLHELRAITSEAGNALIFDEMITGFRLEPGGAQAYFGVDADIATYGKIIGGGMPIGVIAGRAAFMDAVDGGTWQYGDTSHPRAATTFMAGTFSKHPLTMAAAKGTLTEIKAQGPALQATVNARTARLGDTLNAYFAERGLSLRVVYCGSLFRFAFNQNLDLFFYHLLLRGIYMWEGRSCFLSAAHSDADVDYIIDAVKESIEAVQAGGFLASASDAPALITRARVPFPALAVAPAPVATVAKRPTAKKAIAAQTKAKIGFSLYCFGDYEADYRANKYDLLIESAKFGDENGFEAIWMPERHFHSFGGFSPNPSIVCAALARETERLQLRAGSVVVPLHHPIRIAEEWSVVDNLSGGRIGMSIATGWHPNDFALAPENFGKQHAVMFENLTTIQQLWRGEEVSVPNGKGNLVPVKIFPQPKQTELPVWVTVVKNPDMYVKAGELGAGILTNLMGQTVEDVERNLKIYREALVANGHDASKARVALLLHTFIAEDAADAQAQARQPFYEYLKASAGLFKTFAAGQGINADFDTMSVEDQNYLFGKAFGRYVATSALIGSPDSCQPIVDRLYEIGVTEIGAFIDFGVAPDTVMAHLPYLDTLRQRYVEQDTLPPYNNGGGKTQTSTPVTIAAKTVPAQSVASAAPVKRVVAAQTEIITAPLTEGQKQLWILAAMGEGGELAGYPSACLRINGALDTAALGRVFQHIVNRHSALRSYYGIDGERQFVRPEVTIEVPLFDFSTMTGDAQQAAIDDWFEQENNRVLPLAKGPLFKARLLKLATQEHVLVIKAHHIVTDGWSIGVILDEISTLYAAEVNGIAAEIAPPSMQYYEYIEKIEAYDRSPAMQVDEAYWLNHFKDNVPVLNLPADRPRPPVKQFHGGRVSRVLSAPTVSAIKKVARQNRSTLVMTLLATYTALLHRLSGQDDLVVGIPVALRPEGTEQVVGYCTNMIPVRSTLAADARFTDHLKTLRVNLLQAYEHLFYPLIRLSIKLNVVRDASLTPFVSTIFNMERRIPAPTMVGLEAEWYSQPLSYAGFDLGLNVTEIEGQLMLDWNFSADIYDTATIERWASYFEELIAAVIETVETPVATLTMLTAADTTQLVTTWNATERDFPTDLVFHQLFEAQVDRTPNTIALVYETQQLTYAEVNNRANQLAHQLQALGVEPDNTVGLYVNRSVQTVVGMLGILKAGGAYVPLDPGAPTDRIEQMLATASVKAVVAEENLLSNLPTLTVPVIVVNDTESGSSDAPTTNPTSNVTASNLMYVVFTSGSTGQPKGVAVEQGNLTNYLYGIQEAIQFPTAASYALVSTFAADLGNTVIFPALATGGTLHVIAYERATNPIAFADYMERHAIDCLKIVPSHFEALLNVERPERVIPRARLIFGGEASRWETIERLQALRPDCQIFNHYGPTETTVGVLTYPLSGPRSPHYSATPPLGRPLANSRMMVLDTQGQPVPIGIPGELYIGGAGVARGYIGKPDLTAERFIRDNFVSVAPPLKSGEGLGRGQDARLYKTGDLVRYLPDGNLEFLGRADDQVKIRGFRVELGEIQATVAQHPDVQEVVVTTFAQKGEKRLVAYLVGKTGKVVDIAAVKLFLQEKLPAYMVPTVYMTLDALPLTANGKINRAALPAPTATTAGTTRDVVAPRTSTEETLAQIWGDVLTVSDISVHDNFFDLGGHSLIGTQILSRVYAAFAVELPLRALFERYTIARQAELIDTMRLEQVEGDVLADMLAEIESLSDEEVQQLLAAS